MIRLRKLLSEALLEQQNKERLRILFVGDDNMRFAQALMKSLNASGTVNNFKGTTASQILKIVKRQINESYDVVVIMASSYDGAPGKSRTAIKNLEEAFNLAKQYDAKLIAISNPSKSYLTPTDSKYKDHEYPSNDEIGIWVNNQTISDATIDVNSLGSKYLAGDHATLNTAAQKFIIGQLRNTILGFDIKPTADDETQTKLDKIDSKQRSTTDVDVTPSTVADTSAADASIDVTKGELATPKQIYDFLIGKGFSPAGAAGILGNMRSESNFKTGALGDSGTSIGLVQWHASRKDRLFSWAKQNNLDPMSVDGQLQYLWWEMNKSFSKLVTLLKTIQDPKEAAYQFAKQFERPAVIANARMIGAQQYYDEFSK